MKNLVFILLLSLGCLNAIINGYTPTKEEIKQYLYLPESCTPLPCTRTPPQTAFEFPTVPYSQNPCVAQLIAIATQNALNSYNQYVDSLMTSIVSKYNAHCLKAIENFEYTYTDKEYHFTLYYYDQAGNLVKTIPPGKIKEVIRSSGSSKKNLKYDYDASGNRISKHILSSSNVWEKSEYYLVDDDGNILSVYELEATGASPPISFVQTEKNIFGASRLGSDKTPIQLIGYAQLNNQITTNGYKQFDGGNHLGSVLVTFTDKRLPIDLNSDNLIDEYWPDVISSSDYYAFGVKMKNRSFENSNNRFGYQGSHKDSELSENDENYSTFYRELDTDIGSWFELDPKSSPWESPYVSMGNNPIWRNDVLGDEFDEKSQKEVNKVKDKITVRQGEVQKQIESVDNKISNLSSKANLTGNEQKELKNLNKEKTNLEIQKKELSEAVGEIKVLEDSKQKFTIQTGKLFLGGGGKSTYSGDVFVISLGRKANESTLGHELKHGFQFLKGEISFTSNGKGVGYLSTIGDEVNAYKRQYAIDPTRVSSNMLNVNTSNNITGGKVRKLSHHYKHLPGGDRNLDNPNDRAKAVKQKNIFVSDANRE